MADKKERWYHRLFQPKPLHRESKLSWLRSLITGSLFKISDVRSDSGFSNILTQIQTMRALANDSQISTALNYYATDASITNTAGESIWATPLDNPSESSKVAADLINDIFRRYEINRYVRDHILELATIGNLYIPTTTLYSEVAEGRTLKVALDNNTIPNSEYDIIPSTKIPPEDIIHLWEQGKPKGYILDPESSLSNTESLVLLPEDACIHFTLGGLLGDYKFDSIDKDGNTVTYDIQFATPLMARAVQPTQTLSLIEDATVLSSLTRTIKFIHVRCGTDEEEIRDSLQQIKDAIEQQLSLNTANGDAQSFVNPQSPNNLIYLPYVNDSEALSITDLNMAESSDADNKLLEYYQDKKLSVLGVPKEAMNFSSNEGLGGAGSVLSQRSALYANSLQRLELAYMNGWADAFNKYFQARNMLTCVNNFKLHMNPIITPLSTVAQERRDSVLSQASSIVELLKGLGVKDTAPYTNALTEIMTEAFPQTGSDAVNWKVDVEEEGDDGGF